MPRILYFLAVLALSGASPLFAESRVDVDGNALYGWCRTQPGGLPNESVGGYCAGFIHGVVGVHGERTTIYGHRACLPMSVTVRQLRRMVVKWLEDHPEKRHLIAHGLVGEALSQTYPCR